MRTLPDQSIRALNRTEANARVTEASDGRFTGFLRPHEGRRFSRHGLADHALAGD